jgi:SAM-dependent methyltransferase
VEISQEKAVVMLTEIAAATPPQVEAEVPQILPTDPNLWTPQDRKRAYGRRYFQGNDPKDGGYPYYQSGMRDFLVRNTVENLQATSTLELGAARGFVVKALEDRGIPSKGLDVSRFAQIHRVTNSVIPWDVTCVPWPFPDGAFDVCFSVLLLDLIPEHLLPAVIGEIGRVSARGFHSVDFNGEAIPLAKARCVSRSRAWWETLFASHTPSRQALLDARTLYQGPVRLDWRIGPPRYNCGSWMEMFHYVWKNFDSHDLKQYAKEEQFDFVQYDLTSGIPAPSNVALSIVASHFLDLFPQQVAFAFLRECWRVLMPGGTLRVAVPDATKLSALYTSGQLSLFDELNDDVALAPSDGARLFALLAAGKGTLYEAGGLVDVLQRAGFTKVRVAPFNVSRSRHIQLEAHDTLPDLSLYVEGSKLTL